MIELYYFIVKASVDKDKKAAWELVLQFNPYIRRICYDSKNHSVNEDMVSDINIHLHKRILGFEIKSLYEGG